MGDAREQARNLSAHDLGARALSRRLAPRRDDPLDRGGERVDALRRADLFRRTFRRLAVARRLQHRLDGAADRIGFRMPGLMPTPDQATRVATSGLSSVSPAMTMGTSSVPNAQLSSQCRTGEKPRADRVEAAR